ncbi:MAG: hypothetical protein A2Y41_13295 [Spirochaetes bacterium GWB1_36_13]|nr:MAG: hypothetical protein A2Y41_13295 [Spirochaetes bacterium GWB1_36_13]
MSLKKGLLLFLAFTLIIVSCKKKEDTTTSETVEISKEPRTQKIAVTFVLGKAAVKTEKSEVWAPVKVGYILNLNDTIRVGEKSRVVLQSETNSVITIKDQSEVSIKSVINPSNKEENTEVGISYGKTVVNPRKQEGDSKFSVRTPAMVAGVRGTVFTVEYKNGRTKVAVKEGKVAVKPIVQKEEVSQKLKEVDVMPGQKAEINLEDVKELDQQTEMTSDASKTEETMKTVVNIEGMDNPDTIQIDKDVKDLVKMDIQFTQDNIVTPSQTPGKELILTPLTVSSFGNEIFINGEKKADDYYSNLFPENTEVLVEVKNNGQIILQQKVILNSEGLKMDLTPKKEDEAIKTLTEEKPKAYSLMGSGFTSRVSEIYMTDKSFLTIEKNKIRVTSLDDMTKTIAEISYDPKVTPLISGNYFYIVSPKGNLVAYDSKGNILGEAEVGNIMLENGLSEGKGGVYIGNTVGTVVGIDKQGNEILRYAIKDSLSSPISIHDDYMVAASTHKLYLLKNNSLFQSYRINQKIFKRIGITQDRIIIPFQNSEIEIKDFKGKTLQTIKAMPGNILPIGEDYFAVIYSNKSVIFDLKNGQKVKDIPSGNIFSREGAIIYADGKSVVVDTLKSEKRFELEEVISTVGGNEKEIVAVAESGNIYNIKY